MTLSEFWRSIRDQWRIVAAVLVAAVALATVITALTPKSYQAQVQIFVASNGTSDPLSQYQAAAFAQSQVATYASIVEAPSVLDTVRSQLHLKESDNALKSKISSSAPSDRTLVNIFVTDGSPRRAARIANATSKAFVTAVEKYTTSTRTNSPAVNLFVTDPATAPTSPIAPNTLLNIVLGIVIGLLIGVSTVILRDAIDRRIRSVESLAEVAGIPSMGEIVEDPQASQHPIAARAGRRNMRAENYRQLRANMQFANVDSHPRIIAVTSSIPAEGKTTVAINLASTLAEAGFKVCLVDADLRRPTIATALGLVGPVGLTSVLINRVELSEALQSAGRNLSVLTSGPVPPNPSEVLGSSYVRELIRSLLDDFDYVVVDTAPLLAVSDGAEVAALADGALLIARYKVTTDVHIRRSVAILRQLDAVPLGVVLNRLATRELTHYGYYQYRDQETAPPPAPNHRPTLAAPNGRVNGAANNHHRPRSLSQTGRGTQP